MRSKSNSVLRTALIYIGIFICGAALVALLLSFFDNTLNGALREWFYRGYMLSYYDSEMATDYVQPDWNAIKGLAFRLALAVFAFCVIIIGVVSRLRLNAERRRIGNAVGQFMLSDTPEADIPNEIVINAQLDGDSVSVSVLNRGNTIPEDKLRRIFEQFYRLDSARSSSGGAGLGLAIASNIVTLHGGKINARSADETVEFTVTLPVS